MQDTHKTQNIYDDQAFFNGYASLPRSVHGLAGAPEWPSIVKLLPDFKGANVLDLGCGYGWFARYASEAGASHVLAMDVSEKMLARARELTTGESGIEFRQRDLEEVKLSAETYDLAFSSLTFHYVENFSPLLGEIFHSLKPGKKFCDQKSLSSVFFSSFCNSAKFLF
jgi:ubiquinone/menaquinone biosynthesis C-methylase UbiE